MLEAYGYWTSSHFELIHPQSNSERHRQPSLFAYKLTRPTHPTETCIVAHELLHISVHVPT